MNNTTASDRSSVIDLQEAAYVRRKSRGPSRRAVVMVILIALVLCLPVAAILAPWVSPFDPAAQNISIRLAPPSALHPFGTDQFGRDTLSRVLSGARTTLFISVVTTLLAGSAGVFLGMAAGYKGGRLDDAAKLGVDVLMAFPSLLLGLMVLAVVGPGTNNLIIAASLALLPKFVRLTRNVTLSIKAQEYITSARATGARDLRIIMSHVFPNLRDNIITFGIVWIAEVVRMEAGLSFLGIGIQPPTASWGLMMREGFNYLSNGPWLAIFPGMCVVIFLLLLSLLSNQLQERFA